MIALFSAQAAMQRAIFSLSSWVLAGFLAIACHTVMAQESANPLPLSEEAFEEEIIPQRYANQPTIQAFIDKMVARYDFDARELQAVFAQVDYSATAVRLAAPSTQASIKNWHAYQSRFLTDKTISAGVRFWQANQANLQRASIEFGIPPEIIVGIIGVETQYGRQMGNFRVIDVLTTLAFDYPPTPNREERQKLFRQNLADFLLWTRSAQLDPVSVKGSYAGAIGLPQFIPSSILQHAISYDGNPVVDLRTSPADAIGSVANYLKAHGWEAHRPVLWNIAPDPGSQGIAAAAANGQAEPHWTMTQLFKAGLLLDEPSLELLPELGTSVTVVDLPTPGQPTEYRVGLKNFYVLTRYNKSFFYAMAVYQLGQQVKARLTGA